MAPGGDVGQNVYERQHYGPRFGIFRGGADEQSDAPGKLARYIYMDDGERGALDDQDADALRAHARDTLDAAAWLEST
jgi:hypothetical protein